jgi:hypothetical protein
VPATEKGIHQFSNHDPPSIPERVCRVPGLGVYGKYVAEKSSAPGISNCGALLAEYLDSPIAKRVEVFVKEANSTAHGSGTHCLLYSYARRGKHFMRLRDGIERTLNSGRLGPKAYGLIFRLNLWRNTTRSCPLRSRRT